jgi:threonine dehydratase
VGDLFLTAAFDRRDAGSATRRADDTEPAGSVSVEQVEAARKRISEFARLTPIIEIRDLQPQGPVALKLENLQISGSFKLRGALNRILADSSGHRRVAAASGGNHAIAVGHASKLLGVDADVFVPASCPAEKRNLIEGTGARLHVIGASFTVVDEECRQFARNSGALYIHPYDDPEVMAGQGTVALEILEQVPGVTDILVAVGGGGLAGGIAAAVAGKARVVAVEPEACPTLAKALAAGRPVPVDVGGVAQDSLGAPVLGELAFEILAGVVDRVITVTDEEIVRAQKSLWDTCKLLVEPAAACAWAALTNQKVPVHDMERLVAVCCGGNVDPTVAVPPVQRNNSSGHD